MIKKERCTSCQHNTNTGLEKCSNKSAAIQPGDTDFKNSKSIPASLKKFKMWIPVWIPIGSEEAQKVTRDCFPLAIRT